MRKAEFFTTPKASAKRPRTNDKLRLPVALWLHLQAKRWQLQKWPGTALRLSFCGTKNKTNPRPMALTLW